MHWYCRPDEKFKETFEKMDTYDKGKSKSGLTKKRFSVMERKILGSWNSK
jgi:hypothetical protein